MAQTMGLLRQAFKKAEWNERFAAWQKPASDSEEERIERAARMIRAAVGTDPNLSDLGIQVTPQGSYHNDTNVRLDSDMDLCVRCAQRLIWYAPGLNITAADLKIILLPPGTVEGNLRWIKNALHEALSRKFGARNVVRGNKALKVKGIEGSRADADLVPAAEY